MPKKPSEISGYLEVLAPDEIAAEIKELYRLFPNVREYYQIRIYGDGESIVFKKYQRIVKNEFLPDRGLGKMRLSVARKAVSDFIKLSHVPLYQVEIMLYFVEIGVKCTHVYGDMGEPFYNSMIGMYEKAAKFVSTENLDKQLYPRFHAIVQDTAHNGSGFHDVVSDTFERYFLKVK